jgi:mycobactin lysine-N-oxygenase
MGPKKGQDGTIIVVGAGPKALAIVAKRHVLKELGWNVPRVIVVEKDEVAANWSGKFGFTDGRQSLGTPPHKDIGFPYDSICWDGYDERVNAAMFSMSFQSHLVTRGDYAKWVDRGRPAPVHGEWAGYLRWVGHQVDVSPTIARVERIAREASHWVVQCEGKAEALRGEGLVLTGPGPATYPLAPRHTDVMDGLTFWNKVDSFRNFKGVVAIIGGGETAASIAVSLVQTVDASAVIHIFTSHASIYSRGESFFENQRYTDPHDWTDLSHDDREEFIERTDRGVFSVHANSVLNQAENVRPKVGRVARVEPLDGEVKLHLEYDGHE